MKGPKLHPPKRVFIGIKLADELHDEFVHLQSELGDLPGRFIPPQDIHLTLVPPFETRDVAFTESELHRALGRTHRFTLHFIRLEWGPNKEHPRLAWITCSATDEIIHLKEKLLKAFSAKEKVPFTPHMTIARFKQADAETVAHRRIRRRAPFFMDVESVELFESPHKGGSGYKVLAIVMLQPKDGAPL